MIVRIPLAPISRKILISERGAEPVLFGNSDIYTHIISFQRKRYRGNINKLSETLTTYADIIVHDRKAAAVKKSAWQIGYHILTYHYDRLENYVWSAKNAGMPATKAIDQFYAEFNITEEDFARESAYKRWQRFFSKKNKVKFNNIRQQIDLPRMQPKKNRKDLSAEAGEIISKNIDFFLLGQNRWAQFSIRDLHIFLFKKHQIATARQLAEEFEVSERTIYRAHNNMRELVEIYNLCR